MFFSSLIPFNLLRLLCRLRLHRGILGVRAPREVFGSGFTMEWKRLRPSLAGRLFQLGRSLAIASDGSVMQSRQSGGRYN